MMFLLGRVRLFVSGANLVSIVAGFRLMILRRMCCGACLNYDYEDTFFYFSLLTLGSCE